MNTLICVSCLYVNSDKTEFIYLTQNGTTFSLNGKPLKLVRIPWEQVSQSAGLAEYTDCISAEG